MARDTFSEEWLPNIGHSVSYKPNATPVNYGDGYELRLSNGLNTRPEIWSVTFSSNYAKIKEINAFLKSQNAVKSFFWRSPDNEVITVVCRDWAISTDEGVKSISTKFEQVFES